LASQVTKNIFLSPYHLALALIINQVSCGW